MMLLYLLLNSDKYKVWHLKFFWDRSTIVSFLRTHESMLTRDVSCSFCKIASWGDIASQVDKSHFNQWEDIKQWCRHADTISQGWHFLLHPQSPSAMSLPQHPYPCPHFASPSLLPHNWPPCTVKCKNVLYRWSTDHHPRPGEFINPRAVSVSLNTWSKLRLPWFVPITLTAYQLLYMNQNDFHQTVYRYML